MADFTSTTRVHKEVAQYFSNIERKQLSTKCYRWVFWAVVILGSNPHSISKSKLLQIHTLRVVDSSAWVPAIHIRDPVWVLGYWLWPGSAAAAMGIWGMKQQMEDLFPPLSFPPLPSPLLPSPPFPSLLFSPLLCSLSVSLSDCISSR